eukprot:TRINITY_DN30152_c0_g2_i1.p1 TRINITY_DN30152_c0_g2~~TRINITY_DN30152_c0_g2_i1.p1  ORF type:complete len:192 (+),score=47.55 TRINITY_DN30152_c0_g2_i1:130-705(+)
MGSLLSFLFPRRLQAPSNAGGSGRADAAEASALRQNIETKGENAYYYAHSRKFEVPADAKVVSGPGLVTGGAPVLLAAESAPVEEHRTEAIRNLSWADDGSKVKVYLQLPDGVLREAAQVTCDFEARNFHCKVSPPPPSCVGPVRSCKTEPLRGEIVPEKSSFRVNLDKGKVTITLHKKNADETWRDLKSV